MRYFLLLSITIFFRRYESCITFGDPETNASSPNFCALDVNNETGYNKCMNCYLFVDQYSIRLNKTCSATLNISCVKLFFNQTESMTNFPPNVSKSIQQLFAKNNQTSDSEAKTLFLHVAQDNTNILSYDILKTFNPLNATQYSHLSISFSHRNSSIPLRLDSSLRNLSMKWLSISFVCDLNVSYQYNFSNSMNSTLEPELKCEKPTTDAENEVTVFNSVILDDTSSENDTNEENGFIDKIRSNIVVVSISLSLGLLIPCALIAYCAYLYYLRRKEAMKPDRPEKRNSVETNDTESLASGESS